MINRTEFRDVFLEELEEQLQMLEEEILRLERDGGTDGGIQRMFRAAHTLKGSSAAMGYERLKSLTHEMEHGLDRIRNRQAAVTPSVIDTFFRCLDRMRRLQADIVESDSEKSRIDDVVADLSRVLAAAQERPAAAPADAEPEDLPLARLRELAAGRPLALVSVRLADTAVMKTVRLAVIERELAAFGDIVWRSPDPADEPADDEVDGGRWAIVSSASPDDIRSAAAGQLDTAAVTVTPLSVADGAPRAPDAGGAQSGSRGGTPDPEPADQAFKSSTIRVNTKRLEHLMNIVGELVIEQTRIEQAEKQFRRQFGSAELVDELAKISDHVSRIVGDLQESVMKVRMQPIEQLFNRFPRMVRDLSNALGKEVELVLEGKETELDRTLIEEVGDPLIHLIRNAIDHGIETPETRAAAGKPARGTLRIRAAHEDNQIVVTVSDDGAGIVPDKIRMAAVAKGVMSEEQAAQLTDHEAVHLIFHPGFSTAERLSDVSGRGVGMDIVRNDIERLNGLIAIETEAGRGTSFVIKLPLTLAIITGLLVGAAGRTYILPMSSITEIVRVESGLVRTMKGSPVIVLREQIIPVVWLHDCFGLPRSGRSRKNVQLVVVGRAEKRVAVAVDELKGNQEIVIKSLGSFIGKVEGVAGATILGDGSVSFILEVGAVMKLASNPRNLYNEEVDNDEMVR